MWVWSAHKYCSKKIAVNQHTKDEVKRCCCTNRSLSHVVNGPAHILRENTPVSMQLSNSPRLPFAWCLKAQDKRARPVQKLAPPQGRNLVPWASDCRPQRKKLKRFLDGGNISNWNIVFQEPREMPYLKGQVFTFVGQVFLAFKSSLNSWWLQWLKNTPDSNLKIF